MSAFLGVRDIASICEYLVILTSDNRWVYSDIPSDLSQPTFYEIPDLEPEDDQLRFIGRVPLLASGQWVSAGMLNSVDGGEDAVAIYRDPITNEIDTKRWANRYPEGEPATNAMPRANVAANWGSFFLLGDIVWKEDPGQPFAESNSVRYPHGIWFSEPGSSDNWDPINVVFIGQKLSNNAILGMFPLEQGLLVVTQSNITILRGTPDDFVLDELRTGISPETSDEVTYWPYAGLVCWIDRRGRIWGTNGAAIERLDRDIQIRRSGPGAMLALDENLFVSGRIDVRVLRSFGETAGWTTMITPAGWQKAVNCRSVVVGVGADQDTGDFVLDSVTFGVLDQNALQGAPDLMQAYDIVNEDNRGTFNGQDLEPLLRTSPLPGESDKTVFWHRYGIRANGPGKLVAARSYSSADLEGEYYEDLVDEDLDETKLHMFHTHGPSVEAMFEFQFEGDVTPEHVTVSFHGGRSER